MPSDAPAIDLGLRGRTVLVTGASSGLGRHFAGVLARAGAKIILAARSKAKLVAVRDAITADGGSVETLVLDVTNAADVEAAFAQIARSGGLDVLVNNAGVTVTKP